MNEALIKFIDRSISAPLVKLWAAVSFTPRELKSLDIEKVNSILIIRPGGIGDAALLLPLVRFLRARKKKIAVLCNQRNRPVFDLYKECGYVDEVSLLENPRHVATCSKVRFDCILDSEQSFYTSALIARYLAPRAIVGFDTNERRGLYDFFVHYRQEEYEAQSFLNLARVFGFQPQLDLRDLLLPKLPLPEEIHFEGRLLVVSGGAHFPTRCIPPDTLRQALEKLSQHFDLVAAIGTADEAPYAERFLQGIANAHNMCGKTSLAGSVAVLQLAAAFVGADSGPLHLAVIAGVPRIAGIFGPGIEAKWGALDRLHVVTSAGMPCRPCNYGRFSQTPPCPYNAACMTSIRAEQIVSAVLD